MQKEQSPSSMRGFSLVEVILATALFGFLVTVFAGVYLYGQESTALSGMRSQAVLLAEEGLEAVRNIRDEDFANLTDGTYGLVQAGGEWTLSDSSDATDIFTRSVTVSTADVTRKDVTSTVAWQQTATRTGSVSLTGRFTHWMRVVETTGDWSNATTTGTADIAGSQNGLKIATQDDYAYVVRQGGNPEFVVFDISSFDNPSQVGALVLSGSPRDVEVSGDYVYIASTQNNQELQIIDVSIPSAPVLVGAYNAPGNANGSAVAVVGDTVYLVRSSSREDELSVVNAAVKTGPELLGSVNLGATANEVVVSGGYAYVASDSNSQELQVVDISVPALPSVAGSYNMSGNNNAETLAVFGNTVVVGRLGAGNLLLLDVNVPTVPSQLGSYTAGDDIRDIALGNNNEYVFLATDSNSAEFQVVDISTSTTPVLLGSLNISGDLNGVSYHVDNDRVYAVGDSNAEEFIIFAPQ